jgi:capsular exopolysaccharide synthesis family protein
MSVDQRHQASAKERRMSPSGQSDPLPLVSAEAQALSKDLVIIADPSGRQAESIRALRTHLLSQHIHEGCRALTVCAASGEVGCTFVAANLAVSLAQVGLNTLLVDADLRRPRIDALIPPAGPQNGLRQCLSAADPSVGDYIQQDVLPNLSVMYAGGVASHPQDLLAGDRFKSLIDFCRRDFDVTIIDTPPANRSSDVRRISHVVGFGLIVTRLNQSLVHDVKTLAGQLESDHVRVVGTILNEF